MTTMGPCPLRIPFNIKTICHPERSVYGNDALYIENTCGVVDSPEGREAIPSGDAFGIRRYVPQNDNDVAVFVQNDIP